MVTRVLKKNRKAPKLSMTETRRLVENLFRSEFPEEGNGARVGVRRKKGPRWRLSQPRQNKWEMRSPI